MKKSLSWGVVLLFLFYSYSSDGQYNGMVPEKFSLEVGIATSLFYDAQIKDAINSSGPTEVYLRYYQPHEDFSIKVGYDYNTSFVLGDYRLEYTFWVINYEKHFPFISTYEYDLSLIGFGGPLLQTSTLSLQSDNFLVADPSETVSTLGLNVGVGGQARLSRFVFSAYGNFIFNRTRFSSGSFDSQSYQTGTERFMISIGYLFKNGKYETAYCASYK